MDVETTEHRSVGWSDRRRNDRLTRHHRRRRRSTRRTCPSPRGSRAGRQLAAETRDAACSPAASNRTLRCSCGREKQWEHEKMGEIPVCLSRTLYSVTVLFFFMLL